MPKLPALTSKKLLKILLKNGFEIDHISGSHYVLYRVSDGKRAVVPFHNHELPPGTLHSILKSAGIDRNELR